MSNISRLGQAGYIPSSTSTSLSENRFGNVDRTDLVTYLNEWLSNLWLHGQDCPEWMQTEVTRALEDPTLSEDVKNQIKAIKARFIVLKTQYETKVKAEKDYKEAMEKKLDPDDILPIWKKYCDAERDLKDSYHSIEADISKIPIDGSIGR